MKTLISRLLDALAEPPFADDVPDKVAKEALRLRSGVRVTPLGAEIDPLIPHRKVVRV